MRDILQSRYLRSNVAYKQLARTSLSSFITQHDEFIKATFSNENFFETNNIFAIRGKNPFLFHYVREDKKLNRVKSPYAIATK